MTQGIQFGAPTHREICVFATITHTNKEYGTSTTALACPLLALPLGRHELQLQVKERFRTFSDRASVPGSHIELLSTHGADLLGNLGVHGLVEALCAEHVTCGWEN